MDKTAKKEQVHSELEEALESLNIDIRLSKLMLLAFALIAMISKIFLELPISLYVFVIMVFWFLSYLSYPYLLKRKKTASGLYGLYFKYIIVDLVFLTAIIHYLGALEWIGVLFYLVTITFAGTILPKKKGILLGSIATFLYSTLASLEYFQILPHRPLFVLRPGIYRDPTYILSQLLVVTAFFFFIAETSGTFSDRIKEKHRQLITERKRVTEAYSQAEEARKILEIRVEARTEELQNLAETQEQTIKKRTKELQKKVEELERFQRLAVGRELKMVELKKQIENLRDESKKP